VTDILKRRLADLRDNLNLLPETDEPPSTTLQVIRTRQQEQDWQRLLFHYLSPDESHGLDHRLLEHLLSALSERSEFDITFSRFDLADVQVEQEVVLSDDRRPDAVIWPSENWFICWELKVGASEGEDQTRDYVHADSFQSINLEKENVSTDNRHYIISPRTAVHQRLMSSFQFRGIGSGRRFKRSSLKVKASILAELSHNLKHSLEPFRVNFR